MNHSIRVLCALSISLVGVNAQTRYIEGQNSAKSTAAVDYSSASATAPVQVGTTLPATCSVGYLFFKSDATPGSNMYGCTATNTWTLMSGAGGGSGGGGTVTSVNMTVPSGFAVSGVPITGAGAANLSYATGQPANKFLATPNGTTGPMSLRSIQPPDLPSIITSNTTGQALTASALAADPSTCSIGQAPTGILANGSATGCATIGSGSGSGNANSFAIARTTTTATLTCPNGSSCSGQKGDSPDSYSGYTGSFTAAGGSYTAYFCKNGSTMELAYNGTTITTSSGLTLVNGATACLANRVLVATASVSGTTVSSVTLIDPHYIQPKTFSFPGQTVTDDGQLVTVTISSGSGSGVSQACYRVNYNQASLAAGTTRVALSTGLSLSANTVVLGTWVKTNTAFTGVSGAAVSIGNSGSDTVFGNVYSLTASVANDNIQAETGFGANTAASNTVLLVFTGAANLSGLGAGQVDACIMYQTITAESSPTVL